MSEKKWQGRGAPLTTKQAENFERGKSRSLSYVTGVSDQGYVLAPSPSFNPAQRGKGDIKGVVLHSTEGWSGGISTLVDPSRGASAHYGVERDGTIIQMVNEKDIAWHAGSSANNWTVGIEVAGFTKRPDTFSQAGKIQVGSSFQEDIGFSNVQIHSLAKLVAEITARYDIPVDKYHIFGHAHTGDCQGTSAALPSQPKLQEEKGGGSCHYDMGSTFEFDKFISLVKWYRYRTMYIGGGLVALSLATWLFLKRKKR